MKQRRKIQLHTEQPADTGDYYKQELRKIADGEVQVTRRRDGNMLTITVDSDTATSKPYGVVQQKVSKTIQLPAAISYDWLAKQIDVSDPTQDSYPWDDCDGWEHDLVEAPYYDAMLFDKPYNFLYYNRARRHVVVTDKSYGGESFAERFESLRKRGASKQVAREVMADRDRAYLNQIIEWYTQGYYTVDLVIEVRIAGTVYTESCGGFENSPDVIADASADLLHGVIYSLQNDGFIVTGRPVVSTTAYAEACRKNKIDSMRHYLHEQDRS